jgi:hydrogenase/urease accessory protein HupE
MAHPHHEHLDDYGSFMSGLLHPDLRARPCAGHGGGRAVGLAGIGGRALLAVPAAFVA